MTELNQKEEENYKKYEEETRILCLFAMIFIGVSFHFVYGVAIQLCLDQGYSYIELGLLVLFTFVVGFVITLPQHPRNWMGFAHLSALSYLAATIGSITFIANLIGIVQPVFVLSFIMFAVSSLILFAKRYKNEKSA